MKIPETTANIGAYYANEENGQWQPNGVILDSGVGGGVVGSGDAGVHRAPIYPVHVPRGHIPGPYVMAGAYYPPGTFPTAAAPQDDFADYMWMENEEEFDKQVMQQLEEEALMEQCIEAMLEDEQREQRQRPVSNGHNHFPTTSNGQGSLSLEETVSRSTLNPLAAEFVPNRARPPTEETKETQQPQPQQQAEQQPTESKTEVESSKENEQTDTESKKDSKVEEPPQNSEPPEVSAADVQPIDDKEKKKEIKKDTKKTEVKKNVKSEVKKTKPIPVKEKLEKKKSLKEESVEVIKQSSPQPEDTGIKPINYAAAAKAMKPKKPTSPTAEPQPAVTTEKKKDKPKTDKPSVQRKNSAK